MSVSENRKVGRQAGKEEIRNNNTELDSRGWDGEAVYGGKGYNKQTTARDTDTGRDSVVVLL